MSGMEFWWIPLVVAVIGIVPGLLAWHAARGVKTEVTTNHGRRMGEYVELISEKVDMLELRMDAQHQSLGVQLESLAEDLRRHMEMEEATAEATRRAVARAVARRTASR